MKTLIFMGVASAAIALASQTTALDGVAATYNHMTEPGSLQRLVLPFRSESYRDGYNEVHDRRDRWTDEARTGLRKIDASGLMAPTSMCRIAMNKWQINPPSISDWLSGCADALHDDLGL
jgi:hypothetical protein